MYQLNSNNSRRERTGWRDEWISDRHRTKWRHLNLPVNDLDCILTKADDETGEKGWNIMIYDWTVPKALIEYKAIGARINPHDANNTALKNLGDMAKLPVFLVVYNKDRLLFLVQPLNVKAQEIQRWKRFTEKEYVDFLERLRV